MTARPDEGGRPQGRDGPTMNQGEKRTFRTLLVAGLAAVGLFAGYRITRRMVRTAVHDRAAGRSDDTSTPENHAQRFYNAFFPDSPFGWGTDEKLFRDTLRAIPHREFWEDVKKAYTRLTQDTGTKGRSLMDDLRSELSVQMQREVELILQQLPKNAREARDGTAQPSTRQFEAWAERLRQAADYEASWIWPYGTDEDAILAVLEEVPTLRDFCTLNAAYQRKYGVTAVAMLMDELSGEDLQAAYARLTQKPDANGKNIEQAIHGC